MACYIGANVIYDLSMTSDVIPFSSAALSTGEVDRPLVAALLVPTVVELAGDRLWCAEPMRDRKVGTGVLEQFVKLAEAPAEAIRDYARRWGVLQLCAHGLPASHTRGSHQRETRVNFTPPSDVLEGAVRRYGAQPAWLPHVGRALNAWADEAGVFGCRPLRVSDGDGLPQRALFWEPLDPWRLFARHALAILRIADRLKEGRVGLPADWACIAGDASWSRRQSVDGDRLALERLVNEWLVLGNVRPSMRWQSRSVDVRLAGPNLFSVIALQLAFAVAGAEGLVVCSGCGAAYAPTTANRKRRPKAGQNNYCPRCRKSGVPERNAQRASRARRAKTLPQGNKKAHQLIRRHRARPSRVQ